MAGKGPRIYVAGPLFTHAERQWNEKIADALEGCGYEVWLPQRKAREILEPGKPPTPEQLAKLFQMSIAGIEWADAVIAIFDGPDVDSGTSFECGYASAKTRPLIGVRTDIRGGGDDAVRSVNLMLGHAVQGYVRTCDMDAQPATLARSIADMLENVVKR